MKPRRQPLARRPVTLIRRGPPAWGSPWPVDDDAGTRIDPVKDLFRPARSEVNAPMRRLVAVPGVRGIPGHSCTYTPRCPRKVVVEVTPNGLPPQGPSAQPEHVQQPSPVWNRVIGAGLVAGAVVLVAGTLVEDFFTAGAGVADAPASFALFALSSAAVLRGLQLLRGATVVLPAVAAPGALGRRLPSKTISTCMRRLHLTHPRNCWPLLSGQSWLPARRLVCSTPIADSMLASGTCSGAWVWVGCWR